MIQCALRTKIEHIYAYSALGTDALFLYHDICGVAISNYKQQVRELLYKVLNRRSEKKSYTREGFIEMMKYYKLVNPKIYYSLFC